MQNLKYKGDHHNDIYLIFLATVRTGVFSAGTHIGKQLVRNDTSLSYIVTKSLFLLIYTAGRTEQI
jgi:hypothetical protein